MAAPSAHTESCHHYRRRSCELLCQFAANSKGKLFFHIPGFLFEGKTIPAIPETNKMLMKSQMPILLAVSMLSAIVCTNISAQNLPPGQVDFGKFSPPGSGGEFVEVNVTTTLISL